MTEPNDERKEGSNKEKTSYKIPEQIPRGTLDFCIAQLEQLSRIKQESISNLRQVGWNESGEPIRLLAMAHARNAEFSDDEVGIIGRVIEKYAEYRKNLHEFIDSCGDAYFLEHPEAEEVGFENDDFNRYIAVTAYNRLTGKDPGGNLRVIFSGFSLHFLTDTPEDFSFSPGIYGKALDSRLSVSAAKLEGREPFAVNVTCELVPKMPQNVSEYDSRFSWAWVEEAEHILQNVISEGVDDGNYIRFKGVDRIVRKYNYLASKNTVKEGVVVIDFEGGMVGFDWDAQTVAESIPRVYAKVKDEILAHWQTAHFFIQGDEPQKYSEDLSTTLLGPEYNFLGSLQNNKHFSDISARFGKDVRAANNSFVEMDKLYGGRSYHIIGGILEMFDIASWQAVVRAIKGKVKRYGLPEFLN